MKTERCSSFPLRFRGVHPSFQSQGVAWCALEGFAASPGDAMAWAVLESSPEGRFVTCWTQALPKFSCEGMKLNPNSGKEKELICPVNAQSSGSAFCLLSNHTKQKSPIFEWEALIPSGKRGVPTHIIEWL